MMGEGGWEKKIRIRGEGAREEKSVGRTLLPFFFFFAPAELMEILGGKSCVWVQWYR